MILWDKEKKRPCESNKIHSNKIFNNGRCGILLGYAAGTDIYNNTIKNNSNTGVKIEYSIRMISATANNIRNNNFIENGLNGKYNAVDSKPFYNTDNEWTKNYWSDYVERYDPDPEHFEPNGSWSYPEAKYGIIFQVFYIYTLFRDIPVNVGFYIKSDIFTKAKDGTPMCRQSGWIEKNKPTKPKIIADSSTSAHVDDKPLKFYICSSDVNNDRIKYEINWSSVDNDTDPKTINTDEWVTNDSKYFASGEQVLIEHSWSKKGTYYIRVRAWDRCEVDPEKRTDGKSSWSDPMKIDII